MAVISVSHLEKSFGTHEVLKDINLDVEQWEVVCIIGASGSLLIAIIISEVCIPAKC